MALDILLNPEVEKVRKIPRSLPKSLEAKVTAIQEAKDLNTLTMGKLIWSLVTYEMRLKENDEDEGCNNKRNIALKNILLNPEVEKVRKIPRSLPKSLEAKVTAIQEAKDLNTLTMGKLIWSLVTYEMRLKENDEDEGCNNKRNIALKCVADSKVEEE
uniref:Uncharacterized protein n=1 Tax=Nelumbo nucifera TaxID=4432 RepID=A0A822ZQH1_NELNU|nr:TPA_asm: hypothetical protein HUJ06_003915 [Nelumbo nucifera]